MKLAVLFLLIFVVSTVSEPTPLGLGTFGRSCTRGTYNINTGQLTHYEDGKYCGVHMIDERACVSISYENNVTKMGCDNDGGIFPTCEHDHNYCYQQKIFIICCCNSDDCNDCS
uniref:Uncharacterized protein n=1 Tax=Panagrolaimus superbus TaxID=310955 RepID=A0A914Z3N8_9BILA